MEKKSIEQNKIKNRMPFMRVILSDASTHDFQTSNKAQSWKKHGIYLTKIISIFITAEQGTLNSIYHFICKVIEDNFARSEGPVTNSFNKYL